MTDFLNIYGMEIIAGIIGLIFTALGFAMKKVITKFLNTKEKRQLAQDVVLYVEQYYKDLKGEEKYNAAAEAFSEILVERGITVTPIEIRTLIESALGAFNNAFNS